MSDQPIASALPRRLTKIEIENYRAYCGTFRLDLPNGENLLVYGENGAGKSSLFHTLRTFLEAPDSKVKISDHQHLFTAKPPGIKLEIGGQSFTWSSATNDTGQQLVRLANQGKGFLDYKALLEVYFVRDGGGNDINLFPLLIQRLLPHYTYPRHARNQSFQDAWKKLNNDATKRWSKKGSEQEFKEDLVAFNDALAEAVRALGGRMSTLLSKFGDDFSVEFHFEKAVFKTGNKRIEGPRILARPSIRQQCPPDYHTFFNEARLSALAICLFFAALKDSPATGLRILALDDILIGLDMANRVKVLDLVHDHFADWQILIFTYSKSWFERLKERVKTPGWAAPWQAIVLWEEWQEGEKSPRVVAEGSADLLETSDRHLTRKDFTAAAVYARKALETLLHNTCAKAALPVLHVELPKNRTTEQFLVALRPRLAELADDARRAMALRLLSRLEQARAFVLNRNAHFDIEEEDTLSVEVGAALETVKDLARFLLGQSWTGSNFHSGRNLTALEQMSANIAAARELAAKGTKRTCQDALSVAHGFFWEVYGAKLKIMVPLGAGSKTNEIWKAAHDQGLIPAQDEARLNAARAYLYASQKGDKFDATKFEEAAKLLEELATP